MAEGYQLWHINWTSFSQAIYYDDNPNLIRYVRSAEPGEKERFLMDACNMNIGPRVLNWILRDGADPCATVWRTASVVHCIVRRRSVRALFVLLQYIPRRHPLLNALNGDGETALDMCCLTDHRTLATMLLRHGADPAQCTRPHPAWLIKRIHGPRNCVRVACILLALAPWGRDVTNLIVRQVVTTKWNEQWW